MTRSLRSVAPILTALALTTACGSDVVVPDGNPNASGGSDGTGGMGGMGPGSGGEDQRFPSMNASAPTQFTIEMNFNKAPPPEATEADRYAASGDYGALAIDSLEVVGNMVTLTTSKQKLGVTYTVQFDGDGDWAGLAETIPSADTARFWTVDLSSPQFTEFEVVADRVGVGDHVVVYVQQGMFANNVSDTVDYFDNDVYPTETALYNAAPDQEGNDRILLLGLDGKNAYGGYFSPINTFPNDVSFPNWGRHSNEADMLYINVQSGFFDNTHVVAHEFSHLLYAESRDPFAEDWSWHNEGIAECAVHAVNGNNDQDVQYFVQDPQGEIGSGLSLVNWQYGNFDQYVLSYMFLSYAAGQKDGVATFGELFDLDGSPTSVEGWLQQELGVSFPEALKNQNLATWVQEASGVHSYNGMFTFPGTAPVGSGNLALEPFSGAFRQPGSSSVSYPGTQGQDIIYVGINGLGVIDETEPFDASGGALLVFNTSTNLNNLTPQPSGNPFPHISGNQLKDASNVPAITRMRTMMHPPPFNPTRLDTMRAWQRVAHVQ